MEGGSKNTPGPATLRCGGAVAEKYELHQNVLFKSKKPNCR